MKALIGLAAFFAVIKEFEERRLLLSPFFATTLTVTLVRGVVDICKVATGDGSIVVVRAVVFTSVTYDRLTQITLQASSTQWVWQSGKSCRHISILVFRGWHQRDRRNDGRSRQQNGRIHADGGTHWHRSAHPHRWAGPKRWWNHAGNRRQAATPRKQKRKSSKKRQHFCRHDFYPKPVSALMHTHIFGIVWQTAQTLTLVRILPISESG
jgi:hypothetical protein